MKKKKAAAKDISSWVKEQGEAGFVPVKCIWCKNDTVRELIHALLAEQVKQGVKVSYGRVQSYVVEQTGYGAGRSQSSFMSHARRHEQVLHEKRSLL